MVVRGPEQEEKTRQTPRLEGGEGARSAAPEARASADRRECGLPVEDSANGFPSGTKLTPVIEHRETVWTA